MAFGLRRVRVNELLFLAVMMTRCQRRIIEKRKMVRLLEFVDLIASQEDCRDMCLDDFDVCRRATCSLVSLIVNYSSCRILWRGGRR